MTTVTTLSDLDGQPHANVFPDAEPKTVRLTLAEDETIAPHTHPDKDVLFYLVEGHVELSLGEGSYDLQAGDVARFDGDQEISPHALEASTALVVLAQQTAD